MTNESEFFLSLFKKKHQTQVDEVAEQAQRLVNLYRHVHSFNGDFPAELDKMISSLTPEVLSALPNFVGGSTVRQYYDFLKEQKNPATLESEQSSETQTSTGYLPSPQEDIPSYTPTQTTGDIGQMEVLLKQINEKHQQEVEKILKMQIDTLSQLLQRFDQNTHEIASHQTDRLIDAIHTETVRKKHYSDIIESSNTDIATLSDKEEDS